MPSQIFAELSRRRCLTAAGAGIALPLLESIGVSRNAKASENSNTASAAKRLVCLGVSLSLYPEEWNPVDVGADYTAPRLIQPLDHLRQHFTLISNADHPGVTGGHKGTPAFLSGVYQPEQVGQSIVIRNQITLDQFVAQHIANETRFGSLQFGTADVGPGDSLSWNDKGVPLPCIADPLVVYQNLFVDDANPQQTAKSMQLGRSVLDLVNEDAKRFSQGLSKADRARMDQYMTSVREVEARIARQLEWLATPKPGVAPLQARPTNYHENLDLLLELTALALQTDSTRVVSVALPGKGLPIEVKKLRINDYHGQSHHGKDPKVVEELVEIEAMHTKSLARFLERLIAIETPAGSMLDGTQVLFGSGLGNGSSHSNRDLPVLLAGGGWKHGQHLRLAEGTPLCNLFVTMLQGMGIETDTFAGSTGNVNESIGV